MIMDISTGLLTEEEAEWLAQTYPDDVPLFDDTSTNDELAAAGFEAFLTYR